MFEGGVGVVVEGLDEVDDPDDVPESEDVDFESDFESVPAGLFSVLLSVFASPSFPDAPLRA